MKLDTTNNYTKEDLEEALRAISSLISKLEKVKPKLAPGTSQSTLLRNRLKALRIASSLITESADRTPRIDTKYKDSKYWRDSYYHKLFGYKAASEVERLLPIFEKERPNDHRPREAMQAIRAWALGERTLGMAEVRKLSLSAHAAARDAKSDAAKFVAHAAGQAVGTWHAPAHALGAFSYAGKARVAARKVKP